VIESGFGGTMLDMNHMACSDCGSTQRVMRLPLGPRIVNHQRPGAPQVVTAFLDARELLGLPTGAVTAESIEQHRARAMGLAADDQDRQEAIAAAAGALLVPGVVEPVLIEAATLTATLVPCPGSGRPPQTP
jgi:hypothetical protein